MRIRELYPSQAELAELFKRIGVDPDGAAVMLPKARFRFFLVKGLKPAAANILKQEALSYGAEAAVSIGVINCSVERTDAVLYGDERRLKLLAQKLKHQPYGLGTLAKSLEEALTEKKIVWKVGERVYEFPRKPLIMGIINVTPDSFYDGGRYNAVDAALRRAEEHLEGGADIIDIGGESTRPGSDPVPEDEERRRVLPVIEALAEKFPEAVISVDTRRASVAAEALEAGAKIVNDTSGLSDPQMPEVLKKFGAAYVLMHIKGTPKNMQQNPFYEDPVDEIYWFLRDKLGELEAAGVEPERVAVDPGIGFGKRVYDNLALLKHIPDLKALGRPVLIGHSRKSFIGKVLGIESPDDRLFGSLGVAVVAAYLGADALRVHDPAETRQAVEMALAIREPEGWL